MVVTAEAIRHAVDGLGLARRALCVHSSLRSFGTVAGGARTILNELLAAGCTVLVPTFSYNAFAIPAPPDLRPPRNGSRYDDAAGSPVNLRRVYLTATQEIDRDMGALPKAVLAMQAHRRGDHPLCSFSAIGPYAAELIAPQQPHQVYAPLRALAERDGVVVCMGVGLNRLTLLHLAEQQAGRELFRRWANDREGRPMMVSVGGCSEGFVRFDAVLAPVERRAVVGESRWRVFGAKDALQRAAEAIIAEPAITHCGDPSCDRCPDAVLGGPLIPG
jgi:aminoglycoside 3-N-acetyltransferase